MNNVYDSILDPLVKEALIFLNRREFENRPQNIHPKKPTEFLRMDDIFSSTITDFEEYTEVFYMAFIQNRPPVYVPSGQNYTTGSLLFSPVQVIIANGGHIAICENYLYQNLLIYECEYLRTIDADIENQITQRRTFFNTTIRAVCVYGNYAVIEFQFSQTINEHTLFADDNTQIGTKSSQYSLVGGSSNVDGYSDEGGGEE